MSYLVRLLPAVYKGVTESKKWYNTRQYGLGDAFIAMINKEIELISKNPNHYQKKYRNLYQCSVKKFPFAIFYSIDEDLKEILIFGVLHTKRNPKMIQKRSKKQL